MAHYFKNIIDYFSFVSRRRQDTRHAVLPRKTYLVIGFSIIAMLVYLLVRSVDPLFLTIMLDRSWEKNAFFDFITEVGNSNWLLISTGIVLVILSFLTANRFGGAKHMVWHRVFLYAYFLFTSVAFSGAIVNLFKLIFGRTRPHLSDGTDIWAPLSFGDIFINGSFPSGHATTAGALAVALSLLFPRVKWLVVMVFTLVAISRPGVGIHYPSDVFAGVMLGGVFTYFYARYFARKRLLFAFESNGGIVLRGEGRGKMRHLGSMIREGIKPRDHSSI